MRIERQNDELVIRIPTNIETNVIQEFIDYLQYKTIVSKSKATSEETEKLAEIISKNWWKKNKKRFIK